MKNSLSEIADIWVQNYKIFTKLKLESRSSDWLFFVAEILFEQSDSRDLSLCPHTKYFQPWT